MCRYDIYEYFFFFSFKSYQLALQRLTLNLAETEKVRQKARKCENDTEKLTERDIHTDCLR